MTEYLKAYKSICTEMKQLENEYHKNRQVLIENRKALIREIGATYGYEDVEISGWDCEQSPIKECLQDIDTETCIFCGRA